MLSHKLRELKDAKGMTNREIAEATNIPESTIARILAGQTENPAFGSIADIVRALDGSLDEIIGIARPVPKMPEEVEKLHAQIHAMSERVEHLIQTKDKWLKVMFVYSCAITFVLVAVLAAVALTGGI